jgi:histidinol dehydrogenase
MMKEMFSIIISLLLLSSLGGLALAQEVNETTEVTINVTSAITSAGEINESAVNETEDLSELPPGLALGMVMAKITLEVRGDSRAIMLEYRLMQMHKANESETAEIMLEKTEELREHIQEMLEEKKELIEEFQSGEINETEFAIEMLKINMEFRNAVKELMALEESYGKFDEKLRLKLMEKGVNATAIEILKEKARVMSGEDVREIAKMIKIHKKVREEMEERKKEMKRLEELEELEEHKEEYKKLVNETKEKINETIEEFQKGNITEKEFKERMKEIGKEFREEAREIAKEMKEHAKEQKEIEEEHEEKHGEERGH